MANIDTFLLATEGIGPGFTTFSIATQGYTFEVQIITPPSNTGGGGGSYAIAPGIYVPWPKDITPNTRMVLVTVSHNDKTWRRSFIIDKHRAAVVIRVTNIINAIVSRVGVGIDNIKKVAKNVIAIFKNTDK